MSVDSHIQRMYVVVVVFFTLTDRASTIPSNIRGCQSGTWPQRGTKVNGSHHGDNPLLRCLCFSLLSLELGRCSSDLFLSSRPRTGLATTCIIGYG